jgi:putative holliday junction resolvase
MRYTYLWPFNQVIMARIIAIDYGIKRIGIAVTDPLQIIATGLITIPASMVIDYLARYMKQEEVETVVVGEPKNMDNTPSEITPQIDAFIKNFKKKFPEITVERADERFTSKIAQRSIIESGIKKMARRKKDLVDEVSATIILQSFLEQKNKKK